MSECLTYTREELIAAACEAEDELGPEAATANPRSFVRHILGVVARNQHNRAVDEANARARAEDALIAATNRVFDGRVKA